MGQLKEVSMYIGRSRMVPGIVPVAHKGLNPCSPSCPLVSRALYRMVPEIPSVPPHNLTPVVHPVPLTLGKDKFCQERVMTREVDNETLCASDSTACVLQHLSFNCH